MPAFEYGLSDAEREAVIAYMRRLQGVERSGSSGKAEAVAPAPTVSSDRMRGWRLFTRKGGCIDCHSHSTVGGILGPDLTDVAKRLSSVETYKSIAFPSKIIAQGYGAKVIVTKQGQTIQGRYRNVTPKSIQLYNPLEELWTTYFKKDLATISPVEKSLMPADLLEQLYPDEISDLISFLD